MDNKENNYVLLLTALHTCVQENSLANEAIVLRDWFEVQHETLTWAGALLSVKCCWFV